jgi:hypothetical protein
MFRGEPLNKKGQRESTSFKFGEMGFERGKWLECRYGEGTQISLSRRLDDGFKECVVTYLKPERSDQQKIMIVCE